MRRRLFTSVSIISLLICLGLSVLWQRSYHSSDQLTWRRPGGDRTFRTMRGSFSVAWDLGFPSQVNGPHVLDYKNLAAAFDCIDPILLMCTESGEIYEYWSRGGFCWIKKDRPRSGTYMARVIAPLWSVTAMAAFLPLTWTTLAVRTRRRDRTAGERHLCRRCGYDLRLSAVRNAGVLRRRRIFRQGESCGG
jgi:hypothetical protein